MRAKTNIAQLLDGISTEKLQYNTEILKILSDKTILAWILKYSVEKFKNCSIEKIRECIEGKPRIQSRKVQPGKTPENITGMNTADLVLDEGEIYYDIYFYVYLPEGELTKMIINVEAQNKYDEKYDIVTRGIFYCARMISAQHGTEFVNSNYQDIKKVYSIWICPNVPKRVEYTITSYKIEKNDICGEIPDEAYYDLLEVVVICLGKDKNRSKGSRLHGLLSTLLSAKIDVSDKKEILKQEYDIETSVELEGGLRTMCNLADEIEEDGIAKGMKKGMEVGKVEGKAEGKAEGRLETLVSLVLKGSITKEEAVQMAEMNENEFDEILAKAQK